MHNERHLFTVISSTETVLNMFINVITCNRLPPPTIRRLVIDVSDYSWKVFLELLEITPPTLVKFNRPSVKERRDNFKRNSNWNDFEKHEDVCSSRVYPQFYTITCYNTTISCFLYNHRSLSCYKNVHSSIFPIKTHIYPLPTRTTK